MPSSIPIALIDDHELFRSALCDMIERLGGCAPVVADDDGLGLVQRADQVDHVADQVQLGVGGGIVGRRGAAVAAHVRRHGPIPRGRQGVGLRIGSMALGGVEDATSIMSRRGTLPATFVAAVNVPEGRPLALLATIPEGQESIDYCLVRVDEIRVTTRAGG